MTTNKNLALIGAALVIAGLFCPIVTLPFVGNLNLFNDGTNLIALAVLAMAVVGGAMAINDRERDALWPGAAAGAVLIYHFGNLQYRLAQMRANMEELEGNPFAGMAKAAVGSVQLQWGWLVLGAGAGLMIYAGLKSRRATEQPLLAAPDGPARTVAGAALLVAVGVIGWSLFGMTFAARSPAPEPANDRQAAAATDSELPGVAANGPSAEEAAYIRTHLRLYDLEAKYYESMLDGKVPGVDFKIKNAGNRTLNRVTVRVVFQDAGGKPIAEDEYNPVLVVEGGYSDDTPLRPNYIWQNEPDRFYTAKSVPSEWAEGKAEATITDIEFAPGN